jgi:Protein of unknown function (DUF4230)
MDAPLRCYQITVAGLEFDSAAPAGAAPEIDFVNMKAYDQCIRQVASQGRTRRYQEALMEGTLETAEGRDSSRGFVGWRLAVGFLLGAAVAASLAVGFVSWRRSGSPDVRRIDVSQPAILNKIQQLERLETVRFYIDKIVTGEHESPYLPDFLLGDRLLLLVHGEVIGGIDLSKVKADDVIVRNNVIKIRIPKAEVFTVRIDNERTRVYSRETGLFSRVDPNLESEVRRAAEQQLREAAMDEGILKIADKNAHSTLTRLLEGLGFERVELL